MSVETFLDEYGYILKQCEKPSRYIGEEFLSCARPFATAKARYLLAFPDKYEIGISNFGFKILYNIINSYENFTCDRLYAPDKDFLELLKTNNKELYSLELKEPVKNFDLVGFALQYELSYATVLKMLEMSNIPIFSKDRTDKHPIISAGGPCAYNPNALRDFVDIFFIGDGEESLVEACQIVEKLKKQNSSREDILKELSTIEGAYSPKYSKGVKKRVSKLQKDWAPTASPIPHFSSVHDRATVEIRRGCSRLCRFCQSAHTNLPIRERDKDEVVSLVKDYVKNTGYDEYSLLSLSSNDHTQIEYIIQQLNSHFEGSGVSVSLPSQRADNFSIQLAKLLQEGKKGAITLAPEAGTQRMRNVINKNLTQEQIINAVLASVEEGWSRVKLYFMIGLPTETEKDLDGILELLGEINLAIKSRGLKLPNITCSVSILVPKPFTPFQWCAQKPLEETYAKLDYMRDRLKELRLKNIKLNFHNPKISQVEAFFSRADERMGAFIYEMYKQGSYMDSWDENFYYAKYVETANSLGMNIESEATKELDINAKLPWDFIDISLDANYLKQGLAKALIS